MQSAKRRGYKGICGVAVAAGLLASCSVLPVDLPDFESESFVRHAASHGGATPSPAPASPGASPKSSGSGPAQRSAVAPLAPLGAFLRSDSDGVRRITQLQSWLGGTELKVAHTYLPGDLWSNIEGRPEFLRPWTRWREQQKDRFLVLNVPMLERNEDGLPDDEVRGLLRQGADGRFDNHYRTLAERLVRLKSPDTVIVLGWEMNGLTYSHRCAPDPGAWTAYWRRIVNTMRSVPGQQFRFDFAPSRGSDAFPWTECYPGDDFVDIVGMDTYDQPEGTSFDEQVNEPHGLQAQVDFARDHGKAVSYPEWGLFRNGDNPEYVRRMLDWFDRHKPLYQTLTDYCPHGVWQCSENPASAETFRAALYARSGGASGPPGATPSPSRTAVPVPTEPGSRIPWYEKCFVYGRYCVRFDKVLPDWWTSG
ncbi:glycosyl hydrolase, partial [Streptomyces nanshensis]|uniref:glycoside hydrolase family 26 protein n=1 Tax=Streptomyces nanshensis TaxID=518642 RepID=UPI00085CB5C6